MKVFAVAVQPDTASDPPSSVMWTKLLREQGHEVREVNVYGAGILDELHGCHGFMWRFGHYPNMLQIARRLLPVLEDELGLLVYPNRNTAWHYDDKIAQSYVLSAAKIPIPQTWVFYDRDLALEWAKSADYPLVWKLASGAGSSNVRLVRDSSHADKLIRLMFDRGIHDTRDIAPWPKRARSALRDAAKRLIGRVDVTDIRKWTNAWDLQRNYVLFQEFLAGNDYDTRVTVVGNRAFGFRRFNRPEDFRASGSGRINYELDGIDPKFVRLAFEVASKLKTQSCAIDGLWRGSEAVVGEISYCYMSTAVYDCAGHWDSDLNWHEGQMWPEEAQIEDFVEALRQRFPD